MSSAVARSGTCQRLTTRFRAPAYRKPSTSPMSPSPRISRPRAVSQPLSTTKIGVQVESIDILQAQQAVLRLPSGIELRERQRRQPWIPRIDESVRREMHDPIVAERCLEHLLAIGVESRHDEARVRCDELGDRVRLDACRRQTLEAQRSTQRGLPGSGRSVVARDDARIRRGKHGSANTARVFGGARSTRRR